MGEANLRLSKPDAQKHLSKNRLWDVIVPAAAAAAPIAFSMLLMQLQLLLFRFLVSVLLPVLLLLALATLIIGHIMVCVYT